MDSNFQIGNFQGNHLIIKSKYKYFSEKVGVNSQPFTIFTPKMN